MSDLTAGVHTENELSRGRRRPCNENDPVPFALILTRSQRLTQRRPLFNRNKPAPGRLVQCSMDKGPLIEFAEAIFDFVATLDQALAEATKISLADSRRAAEVFQSDVERFYEGLEDHTRLARESK
jgi:hypothetical protein